MERFLNLVDLETKIVGTWREPAAVDAQVMSGMDLHPQSKNHYRNDYFSHVVKALIIASKSKTY